MRISKDPAERKQEIIETAMRLFYEKGYEKTSISDIAREMNVAQGLCYRYFPSKEALFDTAVEQYAQLQVDQMTSILKKQGMTLIEIVEQMPTFIEAEQENSYMKKVFHGPGSREIHLRLSMSICAKMQPIVQKLLEEANDGERHRYRILPPLLLSVCTDSLASFWTTKSHARSVYSGSRRF